MASIGAHVLGFRSAMDLGAYKTLAQNGLLTTAEKQRIGPRLRERAKALPENERRRAERLGAKVADLPKPEQHRYRDGLVKTYR